MGRTMNTYPVSEPEMEQISSLSAQAAGYFSAATFLIGIGASIWVNAMFYTQLTPEGAVATKFVAPFLVGFGVISGITGFCAQMRRRGKWARIRAESNPIQAVATSTEMVVQAETTVISR